MTSSAPNTGDLALDLGVVKLQLAAVTLDNAAILLRGHCDQFDTARDHMKRAVGEALELLAEIIELGPMIGGLPVTYDAEGRAVPRKISSGLGGPVPPDVEFEEVG